MIASSPAGASSRPSREQLGEQLGVVDDLVVAAEVAVLVPERVEAVRAARDDPRHAGLPERRDVLPRLRLERVLVAHPPRRVARARLARAEDRDVEPRPQQQRRRRARGRAGALVERRGAADPVEDLGRRVAGLEHAHVEAVGPRGALRPAALPHGFEERPTSRSIVPASAGKRDSTITRCRRRSTMWSTCSIETGHSCTQAPHVTQSQTTSSVTAPGTSAVASPPSSTAGPSANSRSRRPMISSFGDSSLPVAHAGQTSWQRPHSVQDIVSSICFHVMSASVPAPSRSALSSSTSKSSGSSLPRARVRPNQTLIPAVAMWRCFEYGRYTRNAEDREHVEPDEDRARAPRASRPSPKSAGDRVRHRRPAGRPLVQAERDLRRVPAEQRRHDQRDQPEDQVGLAEVAPLEPRRPLHLADPERRRRRRRARARRRGRRGGRTSPGARARAASSPRRRRRGAPSRSSGTRTMNPQKMNAWTRPGTRRWRSFRWPRTTVASAFVRRPRSPERSVGFPRRTIR